MFFKTCCLGPFISRNFRPEIFFLYWTLTSVCVHFANSATRSKFEWVLRKNVHIFLKNENFAKSYFRNYPNYSKRKHPEIVEVIIYRNLSKINNKIAKVKSLIGMVLTWFGTFEGDRAQKSCLLLLIYLFLRTKMTSRISGCFLFE